MSLISKSCFIFLFSVLLSVALGRVARANDSISQPLKTWQSSHFSQNKLVGKIWSTKDQKFVSWHWFQNEIKSARFLLLGEIHDNPDHHLLQAALLAQLNQRDAPIKLVVEMIPPSLGTVYNDFKHSETHPRRHLAKLGRLLKWKKRGWGEWANYSPIFDIALKVNADVKVGNIDRKTVKRIGFKGIKAITPDEKNKWSLTLPYTQAQKTLLDELLYQSHCKFVPKTSLGPMRLVQQVRDGAMADAMLGDRLAAPRAGVSVLIAGSGHARNDIAVPRILRAKAPKAKVISISFTEVTSLTEITGAHKNAKDYERQSADKQPVFDYLFFTPKFEIKDHCAALAKRFGKHKHKKPTIKQ